jgi:hypothetical protein
MEDRKETWSRLLFGLLVSILRDRPFHQPAFLRELPAPHETSWKLI